MNNLTTIPSPARTDSAYNARMHELFARDDKKGWEREFSGDDLWRAGTNGPRTILNAWMQDHIVHAVEHCPDIMGLWMEVERVPGFQKHRHTTKTMRFLAQGLEVLDEPAKIRLLEGNGVGKAQQVLHEHLVVRPSRSKWVKVCSPAWVGAPGSALRRAAEDAGWTSEYLPMQVARFIEEPRSQEWAAWMPYPHSVAALAWVEEALQSSASMRDAMGTTVKTSQVWANAQDVALSQLLCAHAPVELHHLWQAHPNMPALALEDARQLLSVVKAHVALGMWQELGASVVNGNVFHCMDPQNTLALPALDGP